MDAAHSDDDWRPGFARRARNFDEVCELAVQWEWHDGFCAARLKDAIAVGTPELTAGERSVLGAYATYLNEAALKESNACVFPSTALIARQLGCSPASVRAHRRTLEAKGYMVRDYNRANRPADYEAFNLAPSCARLGEMEANKAGARMANTAERERQREHVVDLKKYRAQAPENRRLKQSHRNASSTVPEADAPVARTSLPERQAAPGANVARRKSSGPRRDSGPSDAFCSPKGASGSGGALPPHVTAELVRRELQAAVQVSPRIARLVPPSVVADPSSVAASVVAGWVAAAQDLLPEADRNNDRTFTWAFARHGVRALAMLAIALEDPDVKSPCHYFGWMASRDPRGAPDLRLNFARILKRRGLAEMPGAFTPIFDRPGADDPVWSRIDAQLRRIVREGAYGSWFSSSGFHGLDAGVLKLSVHTSVAADKIRGDYVGALRQAAEACGLVVNRVEVTVRPSKERWDN